MLLNPFFKLKKFQRSNVEPFKLFRKTQGWGGGGKPLPNRDGVKVFGFEFLKHVNNLWDL